ncbi:ATP-dependent RNA helicase DDX24 [Sardina pilchardus]|uniref:ATP-dependent RNA helicase DDX24 n=1 Tax=Sardina pilchardus TaxID=27697 RepID=UPI002E124704
MKPKKPLPTGRRLSSHKRGILIKGKWKAVQLDPSLFANEDMGGLVCFEELTDYSLVNSDRALISAEEKPEKMAKKKNKKRKASELDAEEEEVEILVDEEGELEDEEEAAASLGEDEDAEQEDVGPEGDDAEVTEKPAKKKRKKQKKKKKKKETANEADTTATETGQEMSADQTTEDGQETTNKSQDDKTEDSVQSKKKDKKKKEKKKKPDVTKQTEASQEEPVSPPQGSQLKNKKEKKKKKKKPDVAKQTPASQEAPASAPPGPQPMKKKEKKNWTSAALGGASGAADVSAWKDLFVPEPVLQALSKLGYSAPTPIQALALPPAIRDHMDILGAAETGSGKTLSFGIPVIHNILEWKRVSENWKMSRLSDTTPQEEGAVSPPASDAADAADTITTTAEEETSESTTKQDEPVEGVLETPSVVVTEADEPVGAAVETPSVVVTEADEPVGAAVETPSVVVTEADEPVGAAVETPSVVVTEADAENEDDAVEGEEDDEEKDDGEEDDVSQDGEGEEEEDDGLEGHEDEWHDLDDDEDDGGDGGGGNDVDQVQIMTSQTGLKKPDEASDKQPLLALVLTPTRELAVQVKHHIDAVAQFTGIKTAIIVGGMAPQKQNRVLSRKPEIVIATPGRLWDLIREGHSHLTNLRHLRSLVIDEADRMVERGHFAELDNLLEMLSTSQFNPKRQTFVFSATLTMVHSLPMRVQQKKGRKVQPTSKLDLLMQKVGIKDKPKVIDLTRKEATVETLTETRLHCEKEEKDLYLYYFLSQYPGRTMVFANSIDCIKRLNSLLVILDQTPLPLHANMHQKQRLKNLERFAERDNCVLLTTDVAARGLDIPNVQHVLHYQVPRTSETYVHRSGRTARATKQGLSLLLIGPDDLMNYKKIYRTLGKDEDLPIFPVQTRCMAAIKERVKLAWQIEKIEYHSGKQKQHNSWFKQAAEAMEMDLDDDLLLAAGRDKEEDLQKQKMVKGMKKHLKHMLSQPVFRNDMKTRYPTQMGRLQLPELPLASLETAITSVAKNKDKKSQWRRKKK